MVIKANFMSSLDSMSDKEIVSHYKLWNDHFLDTQISKNFPEGIQLAFMASGEQKTEYVSRAFSSEYVQGDLIRIILISYAIYCVLIMIVTQNILLVLIALKTLIFVQCSVVAAKNLIFQTSDLDIALTIQLCFGVPLTSWQLTQALIWYSKGTEHQSRRLKT